VKKITDGLGAHAVIVVVGIESGYNIGVKLLRPLGTLVCVGIPRMDFHIPISPLTCIDKGMTSRRSAKGFSITYCIKYFFTGYTIVGSAVGTEAEMQALLKLAAEGKVSTHYQVFDFEQVNEVMDKLARYEIQGRAVLRLP
jgi:alcohol dehydrogenase, propanol-preferring